MTELSASLCAAIWMISARPLPQWTLGMCSSLAEKTRLRQSVLTLREIMTLLVSFPCRH